MKSYNAKELSGLTGLSLSTIYYYQRRGLIDYTKEGGRVFYSERGAEELQLITELRGFNISSGEIERLIKVRRVWGSRSSQFGNAYSAVLKKRREELDRLKKDLESV